VSTDVVLIDEPLAAAVGLGLDIAGPMPQFVVDVGHGITEAAVLTDGTIRSIAGVRVGCADLADPQRSARALDLIGRAAATALLDLPLDVEASPDGVHLAGGGSLLPEVAAHLAAVTGLPVRRSPGCFHAVAMGDAACAAETFRHHVRRRRPVPRH
jgi:rod shape-determining protein MreB